MDAKEKSLELILELVKEDVNNPFVNYSHILGQRRIMQIIPKDIMIEILTNSKNGIKELNKLKFSTFYLNFDMELIDLAVEKGLITFIMLERSEKMGGDMHPIGLFRNLAKMDKDFAIEVIHKYIENFMSIRGISASNFPKFFTEFISNDQADIDSLKLLMETKNL